MRALLTAAAMAWAGRVSGAPAPEAVPRYQVRVGASAETLAVEAQFPAGSVGSLVAADGGERFVREVEVERTGHWTAIPWSGRSFAMPACAQGCRVRYRFLLREAAESLADPETAAAFAGAFVSPPSTWLLHPSEQPRPGYRFQVSTPAGIHFLSGLPHADGPDSYQASTGLRVAPMCAFGRWRVRTVEVGSSRITVAIAPVSFTIGDGEIEAWVAEAARAIAAYYRHFPVAELLLVVAPTSGQRMTGVTLGEGGASILLRVGTEAPAARVRSHWVLTHELMHLGFPSLRRQHLWMEEGMAVFGEPIVRVRAGMVDPDLLWSEWLEQGALGVPRPGEGGLEETHTWARTYWGGALFWLVADVSLRERTNNTRSADDVLRALVDAGGNITTRWEMEDVLRVADRATGVPVFTELFRSMAEAPGAPDLPALWKKLGIALDQGKVVYDDTAPLAGIRRAIAGQRP